MADALAGAQPGEGGVHQRIGVNPALGQCIGAPVGHEGHPQLGSLRFGFRGDDLDIACFLTAQFFAEAVNLLRRADQQRLDQPGVARLQHAFEDVDFLRVDDGRLQ